MGKLDVNTLLINLAKKYETTDFLMEDPSRFLRYYERTTDREVFSFVAAMLSFGNRKQFISKIQYLADLCDEWGKEKGQGFAAWIMSGAYRTSLLPPDGNAEKKFYRFYSYNDMYVFFDDLQQILRISGSFGRFFRESWEDMRPTEGREPGATEPEVFYPLDLLISESFPSSSIVSKGKNSANKRIQMFLRWMVRRNSPVDLGLWTWYSPKNLIIPLDVHVLQESIKLGLLPANAKADRKTAIMLTERMKEIWPEDPCRGDFALFGLGVDKD
ncbi:MAG: TIGR02757 family protein [Treponema sp.]|nr:TIGR02757 family protein [Treponema sp.]